MKNGKKWGLQIAQAAGYSHERGIIHSNLSTTLPPADFGGPRCVDLNLDGNLIYSFSDPWLTD